MALAWSRGMVCLLSLLTIAAFGAPERCDGVDDDGDGLVDNGPVWAAVDADGDGFGDPATAVLLADCSELGPDEVSDASDPDDSDAARFPGATEQCNGLDDDGDGAIDEDGCGCESHLVDGDIYLVCLSPLSWYEASDDCVDKGAHLATLHTADVQAGFDDVVLDYGVDLWIGLTDAEAEGLFDWLSGNSLGWTNWRYGEPNDHNDGEDCVETEVGTGLWDDQNCTYPEAYVCERDCTEERWFLDADGDGLGDPAVEIWSCTPPSGHVLNDADCDDEDDRVPRFGYIDADGDGFGVGTPFVACDASLAPVDGDCDDEDYAISPGMPDLPDDGVDADCDGADPTTAPPVDTGVALDDTGTTSSGTLPGENYGTDHGSKSPEAEKEVEEDADATLLGDRPEMDPGDGPTYGFGLGCNSSGRSAGLLGLLLLPLVRRRR